MRATSIEMYHKIKDSGILSKNRLIVYNILARNAEKLQYSLKAAKGLTAHEIRHYAYTILDIANTEHLPKRLSELETMGCIEIIGTRECRITGNKAIEWAVNGNMPNKIESAPSVRGEKKASALLLHAKLMADYAVITGDGEYHDPRWEELITLILKL